MRELVCKRCGTFNKGVPRCEHCCALPPVRSDDLFDVLVAIVNTAQTNPDRCMADVCNDNFAVRGINLRAEMTDDEDNPVRIEKTSNSALCVNAALSGRREATVPVRSKDVVGNLDSGDNTDG